MSREAWSTGHEADVDEGLIAQAADHAGLARVVAAMLEDLRAHPEAWENPTLERFLNALEALVESLDALMANVWNPARK